MPEYLAPAVYVEEVSFRAPSIEGVGTTTTGFVGPTLTGPIGGTPELLTSFGDFQSIYGGFDQLSIDQGDASGPKNTNYLALSVKAFFDNGGSMLYVSRVFSANSPTDTGIASFAIANPATVPSGSPPLPPLVKVSARFPGSLAKNQKVTAMLVATKTTRANLATLPPGSVVALWSPPASAETLQKGVTQDATQVTVTPAITGNPGSILVDDELMSVTNVDATNTILTVGRAQSGTSAAAHAAGAAVLTPIGKFSATTSSQATSITLAAALPSPHPTRIQVGNEVLSITAISSDTLTLTVTPMADAHNAGDPVFGVAYLSYYANGSGTTFQDTTKSPAVPLPSPLPSDVLYVLTMTVSSYGAASPTVTTPTAQSALTYSGLGFDPLHPNYIGKTLGNTPPRQIDALQNQISFSTTQDAISLQKTLFGTWDGNAANADPFSFTLAGGNDGAQPSANSYEPALSCLDGLEDIAIVAAPGSSAFDDSPAIIDTLITHVSRARAYRVAILDPKFGDLDSGYEVTRAQIDSSYAAIYVPWVRMANPLARSGTAIPSYVYVPPSGFMAGIYARSDDQTSIAKAPANEVVLDALDFERRITFGEQELLNPLGINCLRYFPDRGFRVWGARTASSDSEFMYINVRRYLIYLEHSIDNSTQWAVFENNGPALWARVADSIDSFLNNEFAEGRLLGTSPADSYFVRCDRTTMTQNDLDNGRMICLIGVSVLKPAEFVIFRIGQWTANARS